MSSPKMSAMTFRYWLSVRRCIAPAVSGSAGGDITLAPAVTTSATTAMAVDDRFIQRRDGELPTILFLARQRRLRDEHGDPPDIRCRGDHRALAGLRVGIPVRHERHRLVLGRAIGVRRAGGPFTAASDGEDV